MYTFISKFYTFILLFAILSFQLKEFPFSICCKAGLVVNYFSFCVSGKAFISLSLLKYSFAGYGILDWQFFHLAFWICSHIPFWTARFLLKSSLIALWSSPYMRQVAFFLPILKFAWFLDFWWPDYDMCQYFSEFIFFGIHEDHWICMSIPLLGEFSAIISLGKQSGPSPCLFSSETPIIHILVNVMVSHKSLKFSSCFHFFFLLWLNNFQWSIFKFADYFHCFI